MIKQWRNNNLNIIFFYVPNSKNNEILTQDGVLISYDEFKSMSVDKYNSIKTTNGGYDYELSRKSERLVKKLANSQSTSSNDYVKSSNTIMSKPQVQFKEPPKQDLQKTMNLTPRTDTPIKNIVQPTKPQLSQNQTAKSQQMIQHSKPSQDKKITKPKIELQKQPKESVNLFDLAYPKLMLALTVICSILSIYFTGIYLQRLQSVTIAYSISFAMLIYGLIGSQMTRKAFKSKHRLQGFVFGITATCTILFSMLSSLDVNYAKYKIKHSTIEETYNINDGKKLSFDLMKNELEDNKHQIELLNEDIKIQQKQYVLGWDNAIGKNVLIEGRISASAQEKITEDNNRIAKLNERNQEIMLKLQEYAESGISMEKTENKTDRAKSLCDLIGAMINVSGNIVQLVFLLIPSLFVDVIGILALSIYNDSFEKEKK